jgi:PAS domain S-box-containing protein
MPSLPFLGLGSETNLHEIADALPHGLFTTNAEGVVTFWNRGAAQITGWSREEAIGKSCAILAGDAVNGCSCGVGPIRCGLAGQSRSSKCCTIRTRDGRLILIVKNAVPIHDADGRPVGALESFTESGPAERHEPPVVPGPALARGELLGMAGAEPAMLELYRMVELVARSDSTVMILGESGSGKELVARAIHRASPRAGGPFVRVSCSALSEHLLEAELFGDAEGVPAGGRTGRRGWFQEAHGGTLLLDEIGDISPAVQLNLLRVVERRDAERGRSSAAGDVRLLCATHRDLRQLVTEGRFRADLYFRLAVFPLRVPALREHLEDLPVLADLVLSRLSRPGLPRPRAIGPDALRAMRAHAWPGNVRELQNVLEYAALHAGGGDIRAEHLPAEVRDAPARPVLALVKGEDARDVRRELVEALERAGWNRTRAAEALGVSRVTLWKRMKRYGVGDPDAAEGT